MQNSCRPCDRDSYLENNLTSYQRRRHPSIAPAPLAVINGNLPRFSFPAGSRKQVTAAFDGSRRTSDGGASLLAMAERRLGIADKSARCCPGRRDPARIPHTLAEMIRAPSFSLSRGDEDAGDPDFLCPDPAFELARGQLPDTGSDLCSQPTLSRLETHPRRKIRSALPGRWSINGRRPTLAGPRLSRSPSMTLAMLRMGISNCRCSTRIMTNAFLILRSLKDLPVHLYDTKRSRPVAVILRPGKTPSGVKLRVFLDKQHRFQARMAASLRADPKHE